METRANFVLIGSFTLAVIAAAFGFVLWFQSLHTTKARSPIRIVFEGPAAGLRNGGSVNFNGIRVGEVISVKLDNPRRVVALAMVENSAPIRKDTLVGLEFQGLTGVAAISLKGGEEAAPAVPLDEDGIPIADRRSERRCRTSPRRSAARCRTSTGWSPTIRRRSRTRCITSRPSPASLARNSEKIDNVMLKVDGVMGKADNLMLGLNTLAGGKDGGELFQAVKSIRELAEDFDKRSGALMSDGRTHARRYQPRGEQSRPQPDPSAVRRRQQRHAGGSPQAGPGGREEEAVGVPAAWTVQRALAAEKSRVPIQSLRIQFSKQQRRILNLAPLAAAARWAGKKQPHQQ